MYKVQFLPTSKNDMSDIVHYIKNNLCNPTAAKSFIYDVIAIKKRLADFPYAYPICQNLTNLKMSYRKIPVRNYLIFYWVDEPNQTVSIARIIYARRNYKTLLKNLTKDQKND